MAAVRHGVRVRALGFGWIFAWTAGALALASVCGCGSSSSGDMPTPDGATTVVEDGAADYPGNGNGTGGGGATTSSGGASGAGGAGPGAAGGRDGGAGGATPTGGASGSGGGGAAGDAAGSGGGTGGSGAGGGVSGAGGRTGNGGAAAGGAGGGAGAGPANITLWLAGDSTMATGGPACPIGWGGKFQPHFNTHATVSNGAIGGTSVNDWLYNVSTMLGADGECVLSSTTFQPAWTTMLNGMKAGDYLFIQFGINDTEGCPQHESTNRFKVDLGMMAQAAKDRGANPVFLSSVSSIACTGNSAIPTRGRFAQAARDAAVTYNVPLIDLEALSTALYTSLGFCPLPGPDVAATYQSGSIGAFFCEDHTHFEAAGATQIANLVAKAIKDQGLGLASYLVP